MIVTYVYDFHIWFKDWLLIILNGISFAVSIEYDRTNLLSSGLPQIAQYFASFKLPRFHWASKKIFIKGFIRISRGNKEDLILTLDWQNFLRAHDIGALVKILWWLMTSIAGMVNFKHFLPLFWSFIMWV